MKRMFVLAPLWVLAIVAVLAATSGLSPRKDAPGAGSDSIDRGRYVVKIAGCNDCHTQGYIESEGQVEESRWLQGNSLGWRGPWGTTYAGNLRLFASGLAEVGWVPLCRTAKWRPPMPWHALRAMSDDDLRAVHRFVKHLGPAGQPSPAFVPPGREPNPPYVTFPAPPVPR